MFSNPIFKHPSSLIMLLQPFGENQNKIKEKKTKTQHSRILAEKYNDSYTSSVVMSFHD